eukprot:tig00001006_g6224.t1
MLSCDIPNVGPGLISALRERYGESLARLCLESGASSVEPLPDAAGAPLRVRAPLAAMDVARRAAVAAVEAAREECRRETTEAPVVGGTRALVGPGGAVADVLPAGEFVAIAIAGLPPGAPAEEIRALASRAAGGGGGERDRDAAVSVHTISLAGSTSARVSFSSRDQAERAVRALNGSRQLGSGPLDVRGYAPKPAAGAFTGDHAANLSWCTGQPSGLAFVEFESPEGKQRVLQEARSRRGNLKNMIRVSNSASYTLFGSSADVYAFVQDAPNANRPDRTIQLKIPNTARQSSAPGWRAAFEQRALKRRMQSYGAVETVTTYQERVARGGSQDVVRFESEATAAAALRSLLSPYGEVEVVMLPFNEKTRVGRAVARFGSADLCKRAVEDLHDKATFGTQKLQVKLDSVFKMRIQLRVYDALKCAAYAARTRVSAVRRELEHICAGRVYEPPPGAGVDPSAALAALLSPTGKAFLQSVEAHIAARRKTPVHLQAKSTSRRAEEIPLGLGLRVLIRGGGELLEKLREQSGVESLSVDGGATRALRAEGTAEAIEALKGRVREELARGMEAGGAAQAAAALFLTGAATSGAAGSAAVAQECPVCLCDAEAPAYALAICGHAYCRECLRGHLQTAAASNALPVACFAGGCGRPISLRDFAQLLANEKLEAMYGAAFRAFIERRAQEWAPCLSPDCPQVCRAPSESGSGSGRFDCDSYCVQCKMPWHGGRTCAEFQRDGLVDPVHESWLRANTKPCPRCKAPIQKSMGRARPRTRDHRPPTSAGSASRPAPPILCSCLLLRSGLTAAFRTQEFGADTVYEHLRAAHGGIATEADLLAVD